MPTTKEWAKSFGISTAATPPRIPDYDEPFPRSAREISERTIILQGVVARAFEVVNPKDVKDWFRSLNIWSSVTPCEQKFLRSTKPAKDQSQSFAWHVEAEWTLLWCIGKVDSLGLPTKTCDTKRLIDEIIPALGSDIQEFIDTSKLREPGLLLAEDDRTYDLWCRAVKARKNNSLPSDLNWSVLYERRYAFEWLDGNQEWDDVTCDS